MTTGLYVCHVRFSDVDVYGHVNNVKYFEYFQEARIAFLAELRAGVGDGKRDPDGQVVAHLDVAYRRPILFRPEPYVIGTRVTRVGGSSFDLASEIRGGEDDDQPAYATAHAVLVAFDAAGQVSRRLTGQEQTMLQAALES